jgi:hypothetical protein
MNGTVTDILLFVLILLVIILFSVVGCILNSRINNAQITIRSHIDKKDAKKIAEKSLGDSKRVK